MVALEGGVGALDHAGGAGDGVQPRLVELSAQVGRGLCAGEGGDGEERARPRPDAQDDVVEVLVLVDVERELRIGTAHSRCRNRCPSTTTRVTSPCPTTATSPKTST